MDHTLKDSTEFQCSASAPPQGPKDPSLRNTHTGPGGFRPELGGREMPQLPEVPPQQEFCLQAAVRPGFGQR